MGLIHSPRIVTDGLILCLDPASKRSYTGAGTAWTNLINSKNGTLVNGPTFSTEGGGCINFDATNDYIVGNNDPEVQLSNDLTISAWVKLRDGGNASQGIFGKMKAYSYNGYGLTIQGDLFKFWTASGGSFFYTVSDTTYDAAAGDVDWYYLTGRRLSGTNRLFINSVLQSSSQSPPFADSGEDYILGRYYSNVNNYYFNGYISQACAYDRALSDSEIRQNYLATRGRFQ